MQPLNTHPPQFSPGIAEAHFERLFRERAEAMERGCRLSKLPFNDRLEEIANHIQRVYTTHPLNAVRCRAGTGGKPCNDCDRIYEIAELAAQAVRALKE